MLFASSFAVLWLLGQQGSRQPAGIFSTTIQTILFQKRLKGRDGCEGPTITLFDNCITVTAYGIWKRFHFVFLPAGRVPLEIFFQLLRFCQPIRARGRCFSHRKVDAYPVGTITRLLSN